MLNIHDCIVAKLGMMIDIHIALLNSISQGLCIMWLIEMNKRILKPRFLIAGPKTN